MSVQREEWLDTLRGVTISLVILHHSYLAMSVMLSQMDKTFFFPFYRLEAFLSIVRMPAFFMCSGILFAIPATRGWNWFFKKRLLWSLWISALWGWLTLGLTILGFNIYPWGNPKLSFLTISLIDPVGNMWFIYSIALLAMFCMIIRKINIIYSIFIAISFSILSLYIIENSKFPNGINLILQNLGERGFLYFTIGFLFSANLIKPIKTRLFFTLLSVVVWISCYFLIENINMRDNFLKSICWLLISFPATISAVYILQFSIDSFPRISKLFSYIGQRSLELFLIHQFFIAAFFIIARPFAETTLGIFPLTFIFIFTIIFSLLLAAILRKIPGNAFFAVPKVSWRKSFPKIKPLF